MLVSHLVNRSSPNEGRGELASIELISGNVNGISTDFEPMSAFEPKSAPIEAKPASAKASPATATLTRPPRSLNQSTHWTPASPVG